MHSACMPNLSHASRPAFSANYGLGLTRCLLAAGEEGRSKEPKRAEAEMGLRRRDVNHHPVGDEIAEDDLRNRCKPSRRVTHIRVGVIIFSKFFFLI